MEISRIQSVLISFRVFFEAAEKLLPTRCIPKEKMYDVAVLAERVACEFQRQPVLLARELHNLLQIQ